MLKLLPLAAAVVALMLPAAASAAVSTPTADTYVDQANPTTNYATSTALKARASSTVDLRALLKFPAVSSPTSVQLKIHAPAASSGGVSVRAVSCTWDPTTVTYSTRPSSGTVGGTKTSLAAGWNTINVALTAYQPHGTDVCFYVLGYNSAVATFDSAETAYAPQLVTPDTGTVTWRSDWETGTLPSECFTQQYGDCSVVTSPVNQGAYAGKFTTGPTGDPESERAEVFGTPPTDSDTQGSDVYYAWATMFPTGFATPSWANFMQIGWLNMGGPDGDLPFHMYATYSGSTGPANEVDVEMSGGDISNNTFVPMHSFVVHTGLNVGQWNEYVVHFKRSWQSDGLMEIWHRVKGASTWDKVVTYNGPNLWRENGVNGQAELEYGYYRSGVNSPPTSTLYHDGLTQATSFDAAVAAAFPNG